jgi:hypothetical protein
MRHFNIVVPSAQARVLEEKCPAVQQPDPCFPPSQFFQETGITLAVCLGLEVLANILVTILGGQ